MRSAATACSQRVSSRGARRRVGPGFLVIALAALVGPALQAGAFDRYSSGPGFGNCADCHGDFNGSPYSSVKDGASWGQNLHDGHRDMLDLDCSACHQPPTGVPRFPVFLGQSAGGTGLSPISCLGCHGRQADAGNPADPDLGACAFGSSTGLNIDPANCGSGAGLRAHHVNAGVTLCFDCHTNDPVVLAGEDALPDYYAKPGQNHPNMPADPCDRLAPPLNENKFEASGLDNDGDLYEDAGGNPGIGRAPDADCEPDRAYWADFNEDTIRRMNTDGTDVELLVSSAGAPTDLVVDRTNRHIYWCATATDSIMRSDLDGSNVVVLVSSGLDFPNGIELDVEAGHIYVTNYLSGQIVRTDLDGSNLVVIHEVGQPRGIGLDLSAGKMYYQSQADLQILRSDLDGSSVEVVAATGAIPHDLDVDPAGGKVYWVELVPQRLRRMNLDGTNVEDLVATGNRPRGLALQLGAGKVWWTKPEATRTISRANLDGSAVEDALIGSPLSDPWGIYVVPLPEPAQLLSLLACVSMLVALARRRKRAA